MNRTIFTGDNLDVLRGMNSDCIDLVYLDPPFNSNRDYAAPIGSKAAGAFFKDTWTFDDVDQRWLDETDIKAPKVGAVVQAAALTHGPGMASYLLMMGVRLIELRRVLRETGSIWLHCDDTAGAYLKMLMDAVFGTTWFKNEVTWRRAGPKALAGNRLSRQSDRLLFYGPPGATWNPVYRPYSPEQRARYNKRDEHGVFAPCTLTGGKAGSESAYMPFRGVAPPPGRAWAPPRRAKLPESAAVLLPDDYEALTPLAKCEALDDAGLIYWSKNGKPSAKSYLAMMRGQPVGDCITDLSQASGAERVGYPTQKPLALLERIIKASSNPGDTVLDPFCGCATTCVAAETLGRQWIGIDLSAKAVELVNHRLSDHHGLFGQVHHSTRAPTRTDMPEVESRNKATRKQLLIHRDGPTCHYCREAPGEKHLTEDHVVPRKRGGTDHLANLVLACHDCNSRKATKSKQEFMRELASARIQIGMGLSR